MSYCPTAKHFTLKLTWLGKRFKVNSVTSLCPANPVNSDLMMFNRGICLCLVAGAAVCGVTRGDESQPSVPLHQRIDQSIDASHVGALAERSSDPDFLRRCYLDLIGRTPTAMEAKAFFDDNSSDKRSVLIDKLLAADEFNDFFAVVLDLMLMERRSDSRISFPEWKQFLRKAVEEKRPFDQIVREIITADGRGEKRGAAKFLLQRDVAPNALTRDVARTFLGRDLQCAQCHDHPFINDYSQAEYFGIFAFLDGSYLFEDPAASKKAYVGERVQGKTEFKSVFFPDDDVSQTIPRLLDGLALDVEPRLDGEDLYVVAPSKEMAAVPKFSRRGQLARLVTHPANEHFLKNSVNRFWAHMLGRGIVEPVDFHHSDNLPSHPELLKILSDEFVQSKFDIREMIRQIANSQTYQRSVEFPRETPLSFAELDVRSESLSATVSQLEAVLTLIDQERSYYVARWQTERSKLSQADRLISEIAGRLAESKKQQEELQKAGEETQKQLAQKQQQFNAVSAALESAKKAAAALPDDETLAKAVKQYQERADGLAKEVEAVKESVAENKKKLVALSQQYQERADGVVATQRDLAGVKSERVGLADMVAEARGALRVFDARRKAQESLLSERQRRLVALDLDREYLTKSGTEKELASRLADVEAKLQVPASELQKLRESLDATEQGIAGKRKLVDSLTQVTTSTAEVLSKKGAVLDALQEATEKASLVAEQLSDPKLDATVQTLVVRQATIREEFSKSQTEAEQQAVELETAKSDLAGLVKRQDQVRAELEPLAAKAAELQAEVTAAKIAYDSAVVEVKQVSKNLRDSHEQRFAVRLLKPLTPEQLAGSTITALGLKARFEHEAESEWVDKNKDKKPEEIDESKKKAEILTAAQKQESELRQTIVSLFAAPPGAPQDIFSATADQALFLSNDGKVQDWLKPAAGTLLKNLQSLEDSAQIAVELYLAIFSRPATDSEKQEVMEYLSRREGDRDKALQELAWSLLSSLEFRFNH